MQLRSLVVENFRGIARAALTFDLTTLFIGENDSGKSSLLEALALALGVGSDGHPFAFQSHHARRNGDGTPPVARIELLFREESTGQWSEVPKQLHLWPQRRGNALRVLRFEVKSRWSDPAAEPEVTWGFSTEPRGPLQRHNDLEVLQWLRRVSPVIWLRGGVLTASPVHHVPDVPAGDLMALVDDTYRSIVEGTGSDSPLELEKAFDAAKSLLIQAHVQFEQGAGLLGPVLQELTGRNRVRNHHVAGPPRLHGGAAQKLGLLLLVGAVLRTGQLGLALGAEPIIVIEDPEAHLHPMTLASVSGILEQIPSQKIVSTHSGTLISATPISSLRRLTRSDGEVREWSIAQGQLSRDELRRWGYHIRSRRAAAMFARCWLLVEGETEFWILPELARICGYDLAIEGVACVEFAQSGLTPLIKVAQHFGIEWHLLADGDEAGHHYSYMAQPYVGDVEHELRITRLAEPDIEHCFWQHGFADVYRRIAFPKARGVPRVNPRTAITQAIARSSKPFLAVQALEAVAAAGSDRVPAPLRKAIEAAIALARAR
jgi:putative ATP-dependent endonuclease of OLD family